MATGRVPKKDSEFDQYIRNTTNVLETGTPTGAVRLGLSTAIADEWIAYRDEWILLYPKYTDPAQRTTTIKDAKNLLKKNFTTFAENPLKLIEASPNITLDDRATFRLPERDRTMTSRGAIDTVPIGSLKGKGGGIMEVRVRRETDATRASMHPRADAIEFKYIIVDLEDEEPTPPPVPGPEENDGIPTPDHMPLTYSSKAALWRMDLTPAAQGKRVVGYFRWIQIGKPHNNSGWSDLATTFIS